MYRTGTGLSEICCINKVYMFFNYSHMRRCTHFLQSENFEVCRINTNFDLSHTRYMHYVRTLIADRCGQMTPSPSSTPPSDTSSLPSAPDSPEECEELYFMFPPPAHIRVTAGVQLGEAQIKRITSPFTPEGVAFNLCAPPAGRRITPPSLLVYKPHAPLSPRLSPTPPARCPAGVYRRGIGKHYAKNFSFHAFCVKVAERVHRANVEQDKLERRRGWVGEGRQPRGGTPLFERAIRDILRSPTQNSLFTR